MTLRYAAITGRPGIGKTTIFWRVVRRIQDEGWNVVGFYCPEVRERSVRVGFRIVALDGSREAWLARRQGCNGPRVGKYFTCHEAVEVARYILEKISDADLVAIDEIGPMELKLEGVRSVIYKVFELEKPGFFVVHERLSDKFILNKLRSSGRLFRVTLENRNTIINEVYSTVKELLAAERKAST